MIIGFSTGIIDPELLPKNLEIQLELGCTAVEFGIDGLATLEIAEQSINDVGEQFEYLSIHAPGRKNKYSDDPASHEILGALEELCNHYPIQVVNVHPVDVRDWNIFKKYDLPLAVENMDSRKPFAKSTEEMKEIFSQIDASMVLDINHCYSNDPSMKLARDMLDMFGERIAEIHVSGFIDTHGPLYSAHQENMLDAIRGLDFPIIIESFGSDALASDFEKEYQYITNALTE